MLGTPCICEWMNEYVNQWIDCNKSSCYHFQFPESLLPHDHARTPEPHAISLQGRTRAPCSHGHDTLEQSERTIFILRENISKDLEKRSNCVISINFFFFLCYHPSYIKWFLNLQLCPSNPFSRWLGFLLSSWYFVLLLNVQTWLSGEPAE